MLIPSSNINTTPELGISFMTGFLWFFRRFPQINVGGDSAHFPPLESAFVSLASLARKRVGCDKYLEQFSYVIKYKKGTTNVVADALSRRHTLFCSLGAQILGFDNI